MVEVKDKIYNIDLVVEDIKKQPQTYNTILKEEVYNTTFQFNLRRKINKLCKTGTILKSTIPGTRFGQVLLYVMPKKYNIVVESSRIGINVYYFFEYQKEGRYHLIVDEYWKLNNTEWKKIDKKIKLFEGNILKFI